MDFHPKRFWTPRYIANRLVLEYHLKRHPEDPWWPREAVRQMNELLRPSDVCLEWGSGGSTAWLCARTGRLRSIEHDRSWFERARSRLGSQGFDAGVVQLLGTEPEDRPQSSPYVRVVDEFADGELTVCIVDGHHRTQCALEAVSKLGSGGLLVIDDVHWFLDHPTGAPHSRYGKGPFNGDWERFEQLVSSWRRAWMTDGVSDTAIWIKP